MKPTSTEVRFYGERKLKIEQRTSVHACINSKMEDKVHRTDMNNTIVILMLVRKRDGERGMISKIMQMGTAGTLITDIQNKRAAICRRWLKKITAAQQTREGISYDDS